MVLLIGFTNQLMWRSLLERLEREQASEKRLKTIKEVKVPSKKIEITCVQRGLQRSIDRECHTVSHNNLGSVSLWLPPPPPPPPPPQRYLTCCFQPSQAHRQRGLSILVSMAMLSIFNQNTLFIDHTLNCIIC